MRAVSGSIKKYPITLMKDDIVFLEGDTNTGWERYQGVPLFYNGVHPQSGQMMFETPNEGTIYCEAPIIGCIIPAKYKEHIYDEVEDFLDDLPDEVDDNEDTAAELAVHRARRNADEKSVPAVLRAAAEDVEDGSMGPVEAAVVVLKLRHPDDTTGHLFRTVNLSNEEVTHALQTCIFHHMNVVYIHDLEEHPDG